MIIVARPPPRPPDRPVTAQALTATIIRMGQFQTADPYAGMIANFIRATMGAGLPAVPVRVETDRIARLARPKVLARQLIQHVLLGNVVT